MNIYTIIAFVLVAVIIMIFFAVLLIKLKNLQNPDSKRESEILFTLIESLRRELNSTTNRNRQEVQQKFDTLIQQLNKNTQDNSKAIQYQFRQSAQIIQDVTERLTNIDKTNKQILDFSGKMQSLENILKNPKQRGILGEYFLETLLGNVLQPNQYKMQYAFPDGETVDAAIFYRDRVIPVDAKFSLEKYNRIMDTTDEKTRLQLEKEFRNDIKNRIDETSKYIKPTENTTDFAFMFIPAEGVYYNLLIYKVGSSPVSMQDLIEYAFRKHVIIVSPTSFYAYLETVLQGLKAQEVEKNVREIIKRVSDLGKHLVNYEDHLQKVGKHLSTTVSSYNSASKEFKKIDRDIYRITEGEAGGNVESHLLDRPSTDDN